MILYISSYL